VSLITTIYEKSKKARSYLSAGHGRDGGPVFETLFLEEAHP
jgi:hypothetical protein